MNAAQTQRVAVRIVGWEHDCCGEPFRVGATVEWNVRAADPDDAPSSHLVPDRVLGLPRLDEEHHDQTPDDVPQVRVSGVVRAIWGGRYPELAVAGERGSFISDAERAEYAELDAVDKGGSGFAEYLVDLELPADLALPAYVLGESERAWREEQEGDRRRAKARMSDTVGLILERAIETAQSRYGDIAEVVRSSARSAVTVSPRRAGCADIRWSRFDRVDDGIGVHVGAASWWLDATTENAKLVESMVDAVAAGFVTDDVIVEPDGAKRLETHVLVGSREMTAETGSVPPMDGTGVMLVAGDAWERAERGRVEYLAWRAARSPRSEASWHWRSV